jgi:hypothetical protein
VPRGSSGTGRGVRQLRNKIIHKMIENNFRQMCWKSRSPLDPRGAHRSMFPCERVMEDRESLLAYCMSPCISSISQQLPVRRIGKCSAKPCVRRAQREHTEKARLAIDPADDASYVGHDRNCASRLQNKIGAAARDRPRSKNDRTCVHTIKSNCQQSLYVQTAHPHSNAHAILLLLSTCLSRSRT